MGKRLAILAAALLVAGLALLWFSRPAPLPELGRLDAPGQGPRTSAQLEELPTPPRASPTRVEPARDSAAQGDVPDDGTEDVQRPASDDRLTGRVLDAAGAPLEGATLEVSLDTTAEYSVLDLWNMPPPRSAGRGTSGAGGRFTITVPHAVPLELSASHPGYARARRDPVFGGEHVEVVLLPAARVEGRITQAASGDPVAEVQVRLVVRGVGSVAETRSDAAGRYSLEALPAGVFWLQVRPQERAAPAWVTLELAEGETRVHDIALQDGVLVQGTVTDASSGARIAQAEIGEGWVYRKSVRTDAEGRYALHGFGGPGVYDIHVRAEGYGASQHEFTALPSETTSLDFALEPARRASGIVVDGGGAPIEGAYVAAVANRYEDSDQHVDWVSGATEADGSFELRSLRPELQHVLFVRALDHGTLVLWFPPDELDRPFVDLGRIQLPASVLLSGTVRDERGQPLPGLELELAGWSADAARLRETPLSPADEISARYVGRRESFTDSRGRFHFRDVAPGDYTLTLESRESGPKLEEAVRLEPGQDRQLELVYATGLSIRGRVLDPHGAGLAGVLVSYVGNPTGRSAVSAAQGDFVISGLEEREYALFADPVFVNSADEGIEYVRTLPASIRAGETGVELRVGNAVLLSGRVVDAAGAPVPHAILYANAADDADDQLDWTLASPDGAFELKVAEGARARISAYASAPDETSPVGHSAIPRTPVGELFDIVAPASDLEIRLPE